MLPNKGEGLQFGLLIPGLGTTEIFEPICAEIAKMARKEGHTLLWGHGMPVSEGVDVTAESLAVCDQYIRQHVDGVFFAPIEHSAEKDTFNRLIVDRMSEAKIPVVLLDRDFMPFPERSSFDLVGIDNRRIGYVIARHLFRQGCRRPVFLAKGIAASTIAARIAGFTEAVLSETGTFDDSFVWRCDPSDREAIGRLVRSTKPDGVVCGNDVTAGHLMHCLDEIGMTVPGDILAAGIDDVKYAELLRVPLTTMRQPCASLGETAFRAMLERLKLPEAPARDILLGCELVVRASTVRVPAATPPSDE